MKKCELLSPAGNLAMLKYAVQYGADAVYLSGKNFGARKFANNFNDDELKEAVEYAHLYGVKVYLTLNTLVFEEEIKEFLKYAEYAHKIGVDAVLVQDMGMLKLLHKTLPNLELHASTQMHNNGKDILNLLKNYGVKRVVLDREMSLEEIKTLPNDIEKEVFCHGALCVAYSGQCLFSSMILNRSGNRGACAGMCRLPYKLEIDGKLVNKKPEYYLSLKDLCTANHIDKIIDSGVNCLKIEGRMRSPEYVGYVTKIYRQLIDSYYDGNFKLITEDEMKNMRLLFNREFTTGYINDVKNSDIPNIKHPNHIGIPIGTYKENGKKILLSLTEDIHQGDVIRFTEENKGMTINFLYDKNNKLIKKAIKGENVDVDNFLDINTKGELRKVGSKILNDEINDLPKRKVAIKGKIIIHKNTNISFEVTDGENTIINLGTKPSEAIKRAITKEEVYKQLTKTGNTIYQLSELKIDLDENLFVNIKDLNDIRRDTLEKLNDIRKNKKKEIVKNKYDIKKITDIRNIELNVLISTYEQYEAVKKYATNIFVEDKKLFETLKNKENVYFKYPEKTPEVDKSKKYMIDDYGTLTKVETKDKVHTDYMLNVVNSYSVENLINMGATTICLSPELNVEQIIELQSIYPTSYTEVIIYGRLKLMKMKYNPVMGNKHGVLIDRNSKRFIIKSTEKMNYLMHFEKTNLIDHIERLITNGIKNFRVDFLEEDAKEAEKIICIIHKKIFKE